MHRMILEYITAALEHARYEIIEDDEPYSGEVPEFPGSGQPGRHSKSAEETLPASSTSG